MNKVILTGRFTRDPEVRYTNDGTSIARFSIAVNRRFVKEGSDQKADFLNCVAFGKSAEFIENRRILGRRENDHLSTGKRFPGVSIPSREPGKA